MEKEEIMVLLTEYSEVNAMESPNNGEKRTIPDSNWDELAEAILHTLKDR